jgi:hypothetical protein
MPPDFSDYRKQVAAALSRPGYALAFSQTTRTSHAAAGASLPRVSAPTLVIMGELDPDFREPQACPSRDRRIRIDGTLTAA